MNSAGDLFLSKALITHFISYSDSDLSLISLLLFGILCFIFYNLGSPSLAEIYNTSSILPEVSVEVGCYVIYLILLCCLLFFFVIVC